MNRRRNLFARILLAVILVAVGLAFPTSVFAHDHRSIGGKYDVEVGWDIEPAYVGQPNGASINIVLTGTETPVLGVEKTLKVQIAAGGNDPVEFPLHTVDGQPGYYVADFTPTKPGSYIFTFVGKIESLDVHEEFESGPNRFDDVLAIPAGGIPTATPQSVATAAATSAATAAPLTIQPTNTNPFYIGFAITGEVLIVVGVVIWRLFNR